MYGRDYDKELQNANIKGTDGINPRNKIGGNMGVFNIHMKLTKGEKDVLITVGRRDVRKFSTSKQMGAYGFIFREN